MQYILDVVPEFIIVAGEDELRKKLTNTKNMAHLVNEVLQVSKEENNGIVSWDERKFVNKKISLKLCKQNELIPFDVKLFFREVTYPNFMLKHFEYSG